MKLKILILKNWCTKNITPLAWQRIVLKILPQLREKGFDLSELENPSEERYFGEAEFGLFTQTLESMYGMTFPKEVLEKSQ
ncbi:hypothetical protein [Reichenbachiella sp. MALMAid0571]|uniref:hypothetical protein n=1 Tax=Reichenbachiella sp. MALMAid0571 TaxID=3143939 RepID=UPI0032DE9A59